MTPRRQLSEKGKLYAIAILFPIFWPLIPVLVICDLCEAFGNLVRRIYWKWKDRR